MYKWQCAYGYGLLGSRFETVFTVAMYKILVVSSEVIS